MIDKLDVEMPRAMKLKPAMARELWSPLNDAKLKRQVNVGLYQQTVDLRGLRSGLDLRLSLGHKHHKNLGAKVEVIGTGAKHYSDWFGMLEEVFDGDVSDAEILRADLTADIDNVTVGEFTRAAYCQHKQINRQFYDGWEYPSQTVNRREASTAYYGRAPRQLRVYDKNGERKQKLVQINKARKRRREDPVSFYEEFGIDPERIITRVERQMGRRETAEKWNIKNLGEIHLLGERDPFEQLRFRDNANGGKRIEDLDPQHRLSILMYRMMRDDKGIDAVKAFIRGAYPIDAQGGNSYRKFWRLNENLILDSYALLSREHLTRQYRQSFAEQMAA